MPSRLPSRSLFLFFLAATLATAFAQTSEKPLRVGISGTEPFVINTGAVPDGIAIEIWQSAAAQAGWAYEFHPYDSVPGAIDALTDEEVDVVVGPVSITVDRIQRARFSLPYFTSALAILSSTQAPTVWERLTPFFSESFFYALSGFFTILTLVGTFVWLAERRQPDTHFPMDPLHGIGNGIWFAIVTMSTVGYGDLSPKSVPGRFLTGSWIVISLVMATSLIAGIATTLSDSSMDTITIETAEQLSDRVVAVLDGSPGESFAQRRGARTRAVSSLEDGVQLVINGQAEALVFDRPQLQYFLEQDEQAREAALAISVSDYESQNYGFALPLDSDLQQELDVHLVELSESGVVARIVRDWLGIELP